MSESSTTSPRQEDSPPVSLSSLGDRNPPVHRPAANQDRGHTEVHSKRRRLNTTDFAQRKRAAEACQFCRVRKTKCDSARPRCGFCVRNNATCIYKDIQQTAETIPQQVQHEASNGEVIARLEEIKEILLRDTRKNHGTSSSIAAEGREPPTTEHIFPTTTANPWARFSHIANNNSSKGRRFPYAALRCEGLLKWPCLASVIPQSATNIDSFLFSPGYREVRKIQGTKDGRGINEHALVPLCEKFLVTAHPRNPILDDQELLCYARRATGHGLDWDSSACLVVSSREQFSHPCRMVH